MITKGYNLTPKLVKQAHAHNLGSPVHVYLLNSAGDKNKVIGLRKYLSRPKKTQAHNPV